MRMPAGAWPRQQQRVAWKAEGSVMASPEEPSSRSTTSRGPQSGGPPLSPAGFPLHGMAPRRSILGRAASSLLSLSTSLSAPPSGNGERVKRFPILGPTRQQTELYFSRPRGGARRLRPAVTRSADRVVPADYVPVRLSYVTSSHATTPFLRPLTAIVGEDADRETRVSSGDTDNDRGAPGPSHRPAISPPPTGLVDETRSSRSGRSRVTPAAAVSPTPSAEASAAAKPFRTSSPAVQRLAADRESKKDRTAGSVAVNEAGGGERRRQATSRNLQSSHDHLSSAWASVQNLAEGRLAGTERPGEAGWDKGGKNIGSERLLLPLPLSFDSGPLRISEPKNAGEIVSEDAPTSRQKTLQPSKHGFHARSKSPTFKRLSEVVEKLQAIETLQLDSQAFVTLRRRDTARIESPGSEHDILKGAACLDRVSGNTTFRLPTVVAIRETNYDIASERRMGKLHRESRHYTALPPSSHKSIIVHNDDGRFKKAPEQKGSRLFQHHHHPLHHQHQQHAQHNRRVDTSQYVTIVRSPSMKEHRSRPQGLASADHKGHDGLAPVETSDVDQALHSLALAGVSKGGSVPSCLECLVSLPNQSSSQLHLFLPVLAAHSDADIEDNDDSLSTATPAPAPDRPGNPLVVGNDHVPGSLLQEIGLLDLTLLDTQLARAPSSTPRGYREGGSIEVLYPPMNLSSGFHLTRTFAQQTLTSDPQSPAGDDSETDVRSSHVQAHSKRLLPQGRPATKRDRTPSKRGKSSDFAEGSSVGGFYEPYEPFLKGEKERKKLEDLPTLISLGSFR